MLERSGSVTRRVAEVMETVVVAGGAMARGPTDRVSVSPLFDRAERQMH